MPDLISINDNLPARGAAAPARGAGRAPENEFTDALQGGAMYPVCATPEAWPVAPAPSQDLEETPVDFSQIIQEHSIESLLRRTTERVCAHAGFRTAPDLTQDPSPPPSVSLAPGVMSQGDVPQAAQGALMHAIPHSGEATHTPDTLVHPDAAPWIQDLLDPLATSRESAKVQLKYTANIEAMRTNETPPAVFPVADKGDHKLSPETDSNLSLSLLDAPSQDSPDLEIPSLANASPPGIDLAASLTSRAPPAPVISLHPLPANAAAPAMPLPVALPHSVQQVATHFTQAGACVERLEIQLAPATLGVVRVQMEMAEGEVRIHVHATQPHTLELLTAHAKDLAQALSQGGIEADPQHMQFSLQQGEQQAQQQPSGQRRRVVDMASTTAPLPTPESADPTKLIDQKV